MTDTFKNIIWGESLIDFWSDWAKNLPKRESIFRMSDFDYTLFDRDEQLHGVPDLQKNRGDLGPTYLFEKYGMQKFLDEYYKNHPLPTEILKELDSSTDIIMTAGGSRDFQLSKVRTCPELDDFTVIVTKNGEEKIPELIRYVLFELKYIPAEIKVYEDRPQYFIEYREIIEWLLRTKLTIMYVEMNGNDGYKKIEEIKKEA